MPCKFGEKAECKGKYLPLVGVSWFDWPSWGMEYTYFFAIRGNRWHETTFFYMTFEKGQPFEINIPGSLLADKPVREHGYPLNGRGYAHGIDYRDGKTYIDFIMTSSCYAHIKVQCDAQWKYIPDGDIIFPPGWDTEEKREKAVSKKYRPIQDSPKKDDGRQLTIFDIMNG